MFPKSLEILIHVPLKNENLHLISCSTNNVKINVILIVSQEMIKKDSILASRFVVFDTSIFIHGIENAPMFVIPQKTSVQTSLL